MRVEEFYEFMKKRELVRLRKESGQPWPWTEDKILQTYRFTNVKRAHDKTSRQLVEEFYSKHLDAKREIVLLNCTIFRYFGTIEFARAVGWQEKYDPEHLISTARGMLSEGRKVFTGAYLITNNGIAAPKEEVVARIFVGGMWKKAREICDAIPSYNSWKTVVNRLREVNGFGGSGFMAKEVVLDTILAGAWAPRNRPSDFNEWCPAGPGARRGVNRLLGLHHDSAITEEKALKVMLEVFKARRDLWPAGEGRVPLDLHDIQFQLCEFDKYERVRLGEGRPRSFYRKGEP